MSTSIIEISRFLFEFLDLLETAGGIGGESWKRFL